MLLFSPVLYILLLYAVFIALAREDLKKRPYFYLFFFFLATAVGFFFDATISNLGIWTPFVYPQLLSVSWLDPLTYMPYLLIPFALGNYFSKKSGIGRNLLYFIFGMLVGFVIDSTSIYVGFYKYGFTFPFAILNVPISVSIAEGIAVPIMILVSSWLFSKFKQK